MKNYTLLSCIESKVIHPTQFYGRFELGKFATGQALTVANTLRRSLLSQLPGVAITLVNIENILHEYENIPGSNESALNLLLNLKKVVFTSEFESFKPQIGFINITGPCVVTAADLKLPFFISCVNPDQYLTTLTEDGQLDITFLLNCGKNYINHSPSSKGFKKRVDLLNGLKQFNQSPKGLAKVRQKKFFYNWYQQRKLDMEEKIAFTGRFLKIQMVQKLLVEQESNREAKRIEKNLLNITPVIPSLKFQSTSLLKKTKTSKDPAKSTDFSQKKNKVQSAIGYLPINAVFSPVLKANYTIQAQNDEQTGETIYFEVWTNGSIDPRHAIHRGVKAIIKLFLPLQLKTNVLVEGTDLHQTKWNQFKKTSIKKRTKKIERFVVKSLIRLQNLDLDTDSDLSSKINSPKEQLTKANFKLTKKSQPIIAQKAIKTYWKKKAKGPNYSNNRLQYKKPKLTKKKLKKYEKTYITRARIRKYFRERFPIFRIIDPFFRANKLKKIQYRKVFELDLLNLQLPPVSYKKLNNRKKYLIKDLLLIKDKELFELFGDNVAEFLWEVEDAFLILFNQVGFSVKKLY